MDEVTVHVDATAEQVWGVVSDPSRAGEWSPECTGGGWTGGASAPAVGATFVGSNRHGPAVWSTHCTVTAADPGRHFSFQVAESGMRWGYRIREVDGGGAEVTEYRVQIGPKPWYAKLASASGVIGRNREDAMREGMRRSVNAIGRLAAKQTSNA